MSTRRRSRSPAASSRPTNASSSDAQANQFQGPFTEEDEVKLLKCYLKVTRSADPTKNSQPTLDSPALDRIETALGPKFNQTHIVDKLHRLKLHYHRLVRSKSFIKTPHHRQILEIGRSIWGKAPLSRRQPQVLRRINESSETPCEVSAARKEEVDLKNFPFLVSEFSRRFPGNVVWREGLRAMEERSLMGMNEKWVLLHVEEAELKARRAALLQQQLGITETSEVVNYSTN